MKWRGISPELWLRKEGVGRKRQVLPQEKEGDNELAVRIRCQSKYHHYDFVYRKTVVKFAKFSLIDPEQ
jgi:hypothetical protein